MNYPKLIENLIDQFAKLPGVGRRSAERMVFWVLNHSKEEAQQLAQSIVQLKEGLRFCKRCNHLTDEELCLVCKDAQKRDQTIICVVEDPKDVLAIEKSGVYRGCYHVLLGTISPADGRGPDDIKIPQLIKRIAQEGTKEVILATDPDNEGEMTALYLTKVLKPTGVRITRIGLGIPMGSTVEFSDISTLSMSLMARREIKDEEIPK